MLPFILIGSVVIRFPRATVALARGELAAAQAASRQQRAELAVARAELLSLTGLRSPPRAFDEPLAKTAADAEAAVLQHPRMQAAQRSVDAARAALQLAEISNRDSPEIGVVANRFRDIRGQEYDTTLGLRLRIPFATEARNAPRLASARADLAEANAEYGAAQRELKLVLLNACETLAAAEEQTALVQDRVKAARDAAARLQRSYEAGQIGLIELLRSRVALFEAETAAAQNRIAVAQARSRVNQALGLVP
jgi:outer membrane protein, heavy metal efflux system